MAKYFTILSAILFICGCQMHSLEELDRLTKEDSAFKQMILQRDQVRSQAHAIKQDLLNKKKAMDAQVEKLRQEYDTYAKAQNLKIEKYHTTIDTNRMQLKQETESAGTQAQAKREEAEGYKTTLQNIQKLLRESKGIRMSPAERKNWEEKILILSEKIRPLEEEIQDLKLQVRLKKQKIGYLN